MSKPCPSVIFGRLSEPSPFVRALFPPAHTRSRRLRSPPTSILILSAHRGAHVKQLITNILGQIFQTEIELLNRKLSSKHSVYLYTPIAIINQYDIPPLPDYEERLQELRDVHRLESKSQTDQIDKLRTQLQETEALFQASEKAIVEAEGKFASDQSDSKALQSEIERYKTIAKDEEEKRVKAISLLKNVRVKHMTASKERDEALEQLKALRERQHSEGENDRREKLQLQQELEKMHIEQEKMLASQKAQFDRELAMQKERHEREMAAVKGQLELEIITLKVSVYCPATFVGLGLASVAQGLAEWMGGSVAGVATRRRSAGLLIDAGAFPDIDGSFLRLLVPVRSLHARTSLTFILSHHLAICYNRVRTPESCQRRTRRSRRSKNR